MHNSPLRNIEPKFVVNFGTIHVYIYIIILFIIYEKVNRVTCAKTASTMDDSNPFQTLFLSSEDVHKATAEVKQRRKEVGSVLTRIFLLAAHGK